MKRRRLRDSGSEQYEIEFDPSPSFASTPEEIRRAVQRNAVQRGQYFALNLARLGFDAILDQIDALVRKTDREVLRESAAAFSIDIRALDVLDRIPVGYACYFCTPDQLLQSPSLLLYYRNVAMGSAKVTRGIGLDTAAHEAGALLSEDKAAQLAQYFNGTVSALITSGPQLITGRRHLEMVFSNLGESIGGSWRNEVGRLSYVEVMSLLLRYLHDKQQLSQVQYDLKGFVIEEDEEGNPPEDEDVEDSDGESRYLARDNILAAGADFLERLRVVESKRVVYKTIFLRSGNQLRLNRQIKWLNQEGKSLKIGPDLSAYFSDEMLNWAGELKGGADPAGSDEHWKTATRAFERILSAADDTAKPRPQLSFIATILVDRVAREAALWIEQGKLTSVYNLTQIAEDESQREAFLSDLAKFLGCEI